MTDIDDADPGLLLRLISDYQMEHFRKMIPEHVLDIWIEGQDVLELESRKLMELRKKFGFLFQGAALFDSLPVWQNVAFRLLHGRTRRPRAEARETALMKLGWVLGHTEDHARVLEMMRTPISHEITEREPHNGYLVLQGGLPETEEYISTHWK